MSALTTTEEGQAYLDAVRRELADLPEGDRAELLEDLAMHLASLAQEDDERTLEVRLGSAARYASELRTAAGLPAREASSARRAGRARQVLQAGFASLPVSELRDFLPQLRPAWWVLRGYLLVLLPALASVDGNRDFPIPAVLGSHVLGAVLVVAVVVASVLVGRLRLPRSATAVVIVANALLVVAAGDVLASAPDRLTVRERVAVPQVIDPFHDSPLITRQGPVTNVFPYSLNGTPLRGVLLYDQDGRPLAVGQQLWWNDHCRRLRVQPRAVDGVPVAQVYPQQYALDPEGVTLSGFPVRPGQCRAVLTPPRVALPVLAPATPALR